MSVVAGAPDGIQHWLHPLTFISKVYHPSSINTLALPSEHFSVRRGLFNQVHITDETTVDMALYNAPQDEGYSEDPLGTQLSARHVGRVDPNIEWISSLDVDYRIRKRSSASIFFHLAYNLLNRSC